MSAVDAPTFRPAAEADAVMLTANVVEGFGTYRSFAPEGWSPPPPDPGGAKIAERLRDPRTWCEIAEVDGRLAGHALLVPASTAREPIDDPQVGHVMHLFVREPFWGTGIAGALHARMLEAAGRSGYNRLRLFTPARQARARRFYEREGWELEGDVPFDEQLGLDVVEYRRVL